MSVYDGMILTFIVVGIIIVIVSFVLSKYDNFIQEEENKRQEDFKDDVADYEEVRNKILELNEYGEYLKDELDKKHKELLFLYQMILEKQKEMQIESLDRQMGLKEESRSSNSGIKGDAGHETDKNVSPKDIPDDKRGVKKDVKKDNREKINYNKEILDMSLAGYDQAEIAKRLNIGVGQVELVLHLYK